MKRFVFFIAALLAVAAVAQDYWPHNTSVNPRNRGVALGKSAYVVGADNDAVEGSIAIGDGDGVAYVSDATDAMQIGEGSNTVSGTVKYRTRYVPQIFIDAESVTEPKGYTAPNPGCILVGKVHALTNGVWVAKAAGTNNWVKVGEQVAP